MSGVTGRQSAAEKVQSDAEALAVLREVARRLGYRIVAVSIQVERK
jgi:hypothetical protein